MKKYVVTSIILNSILFFKVKAKGSEKSYKTWQADPMAIQKMTIESKIFHSVIQTVIMRNLLVWEKMLSDVEEYTISFPWTMKSPLFYLIAFLNHNRS